ncbi:MAG: carboxypeptidase regulatory-like domain-containing protein [Vicinamibacterales bacterium]
MTLRVYRWPFMVALLLFPLAAPAAAQDFRGRITGTVTDNTGAVLPGVTITASSPALIQPQVQITGSDGTYRLIALPPGVYTLSFDLPGFTTLRREGVRVVINQTLPVDAQLQVATLQETVTVTGESPVVDTSSTTLGTNFTKELLTEIPNARDVWAAMAQAPGLQMVQYDVGGSRTGTQTGYITYGVNIQNQTKIEGIDTTEGVTANAGYFDFGSFEEFQIGGAGNSAENYAGGASLAITVKSGGDRITGNWYSDWEGDATISDNVPDNLRVSGQRDDNGFFVRNALRRGNPIDRQYDINFNIGGPLWKQKAWFFYSYRLNDQYKFILGADQLARSKLSNNYTFKGTFQLNRNNQLIGFLNKRNKLQELRDFGPTTPASAARFQASRNYPMKVEWTSVLGSRMFLDVLVGRWENFFPLRPTIDNGMYSGPWGPGRIDLSNNQRFDGGGHDAYQNQKRWKPQFYASLSYFKDGWGGSHDFKFGYDWKRDRRNFYRDQPFDIFYRDQGGAVNQVDLYNTPVSPFNEVEYQSGWFTDTWKTTNRLSLNLGLRFEYYRDGWPDQSQAPNGHPVLAGWDNAVYRNFVAPRTIEARTVSETRTLAPRFGFAYDLTGDNKTVLKAFWGKFFFNSADTLADQENPVGRAQLRYQFLDQNGNRQLDGPHELGRLISTVGGAGFVRVDRNIERPYATELSTNLEREITEGLSGRVSYVYKNFRNVWAEVDLLRDPAYTAPFMFVDIGPDGTRGTGDDASVSLLDRPAGIGQDRTYTNPTDPRNNADFHTVELAINRRFRGRWMLLTSFGYTWLNQIHSVTSPTGALDSAGNRREYYYRPSQTMFGTDGRERSTTWNYKVLGRYNLPFGVGTSASWKVQSGYQWGRTTNITFPGDGAQNVRLEPVTSNRAPTVAILDVRADKSFSLGRFGKLTGMVDVFNAFNSGTVTNFRTTTGATFTEVLAILDPRIVRFGVRFDF